jgi:hypothetical protein
MKREMRGGQKATTRVGGDCRGSGGSGWWSKKRVRSAVSRAHGALLLHAWTSFSTAAIKNRGREGEGNRQLLCRLAKLRPCARPRASRVGWPPARRGWPTPLLVGVCPTAGASVRETRGGRREGD